MHCTARELLRIVVMLNDVCFVVHVAIAPLCIYTPRAKSEGAGGKGCREIWLGMEDEGMKDG